MDVHLEFQRHCDDSSTIFQLLDELITDVFALLSLLRRGILHLLLLHLLDIFVVETQESICIDLFLLRVFRLHFIA
jgi:hypothetical protein